MKYVVNLRGRAIRIENEEKDAMVAKGCIEITAGQFEKQTYYPEYDRGEKYIAQTNPLFSSQQSQKKQAASIANIKERTSFTTRAV